MRFHRALAAALLLVLVACAQRHDAPRPTATGTTIGAQPVGLLLPNRFGVVVFPGLSRRVRVAVQLFASAEAAASAPPQHPAPLPPGAPDDVVVRLVMRFDADASLTGFPTVAIAFPNGCDVSCGPFVGVVDDGITNARLAVLPPMCERGLTFHGSYRRPFVVRKGRPYVVSIVRTAGVAFDRLAIHPEHPALPPANGTSLDAALAKPASGNGATAYVVAAPVDDLDVPPLDGARVARVRYAASIALCGNAAAGPGSTLAATLPRPLAGSRLGVALYDENRFTNGWDYDEGTIDRRDPTHVRLRFAHGFRAVLGRYAFALYDRGTNRTHAVEHPPATARHRFTIALLGTSLMRVVMLPSSAVGCAYAWGPPPSCIMSDDPHALIPGVVAAETRAPVIDLAVPAAQITSATARAPSIVGEQLPQVPRDANVVVVEAGSNDLIMNDSRPGLQRRFRELVARLRERAPAAHLVFFGVRCYTSCVPHEVAAWNAEQRALVGPRDAWVDASRFGPPGASHAYPDGVHASVATARRIGAAIAAVIRPWRDERARGER